MRALISAINHPHICALYDVGADYLVMEHCEGKTLAKRLADELLPIDDVLQYGLEIADALDKAHRGAATFSSSGWCSTK